MQINLSTTGLDTVRDMINSLSGEQLSIAQMKAINDTAFEVRRGMQREFDRVFDRVTPYITKSVFVEMATLSNLSAKISPNNRRDGNSIDPQKILRTEVDGGPRRDKRFEVALRRVGILQPGYQAVVPKTPYPGSVDNYGNLKGSFALQILTYFQAMGEQGYRANMTDRRIRNIQRGTARTAGRTYFVSHGTLRGNAASHLAPGIWASSGTHGVIVKPVLMFVRTPNYRPRLSMEAVAQSVDATAYLERRMRYQIRVAAGV